MTHLPTKYGNMALLVVMLISICGCIKRDPVIATLVDAQNAFEREGSEHCTHTGYCMACGLGFDGSYKCAARFQYSCPGRRRVWEQVTPVTYKHESGLVTKGEQTKTLRVMGACN